MSFVVSSVEERVDQALQMGAVDQALQMITSAESMQPNNWAVQYRFGLVLARLNRVHEAFARYTRALELNSLSVEVRLGLANAYLAMNDGWTAAAWVSDACRVAPHNPQQWLQLAQLLAVQKRHAEVEPALLSGVAANPADIGLLEALGEFYLQQKRFADAVSTYERVSGLVAKLRVHDPRVAQSAKALLHHGFALEHNFQLEAAATQYRAALVAQPDYLEALIDLSGLLWRLGDFQSTMDFAKQAYALAPTHPFAVRILGTAHLHFNELEQAEHYVRLALTLKDPFPIARVDLALLLLLAGKFEQGWAAYERRWSDTDRMTRPAFFNSELEWQGPVLQPVAGKRVAIYAEQGLGDVINFIRYAKVLQRDGATVYAVVQADLIALVETIPGVICLKAHINIEADYHVALLELPLHYRTDASNAPNEVPYLHAPTDKKAAWAERLKPWAKKLKIGITWSGHHVHANNHNRCMPLSAFEPIIMMDGVQCFSLQKSDGGAYTDLALEEGQLTDFTKELVDFTDTAALVENLDLVIGIDSSVIHLSAALAVTTWVPLPPNPDWRWLTEREDSPWYPTMRLFRRGHTEPKTAQMARVKQALIERVASKSAA